MEFEWEEYVPQEGKRYSPGTMGMMENGDRYSWVDASGVHNPSISRLDRFRRPKQSTTASEVRHLKEAVKQLATIVLELQKSANLAKTDDEWFTVEGERGLGQVISSLS